MILRQLDYREEYMKTLKCYCLLFERRLTQIVRSMFTWRNIAKREELKHFETKIQGEAWREKE